LALLFFAHIVRIFFVASGQITRQERVLVTVLELCVVIYDLVCLHALGVGLLGAHVTVFPIYPEAPLHRDSKIGGFSDVLYLYGHCNRLIELWVQVL
jgi:hypothetical protein